MVNGNFNRGAYQFLYCKHSDMNVRNSIPNVYGCKLTYQCCRLPISIWLSNHSRNLLLEGFLKINELHFCKINARRMRFRYLQFLTNSFSSVAICLASIGFCRPSHEACWDKGHRTLRYVSNMTSVGCWFDCHALIYPAGAVIVILSPVVRRWQTQ